VRQWLRSIFGSLPLWLALSVGFFVVLFILTVVLLLVPPAIDLGKQCNKMCHPRTGNLVPSKQIPQTAKNPNYVCECF
jgi:hypothetical protein